MNYLFTENGWADYEFWQNQDKKVLKKTNKLLNDISRNGHSGFGKPELLTGELTGFYSRRINDKDRLIYTIDNNIVILACRFHYSDH